jgi:hypothetical protein
MVPAGARVYVQVSQTGEIIQLDDFVSISSSISTEGDSNATINILNKADKWYNCRPASTKKQTDVAQYLLEIRQQSLSQEIDRELRYLTAQALKTNNVKGLNSLLGQIATLEQYMIFNLSHRVWIDYRGRDDLYGLQPSPMYAASSSEGRWYAGFTGIIGGLEESYKPGTDASIVITCDSMRKFFENTLVSTDAGYDPSIQLVSTLIQTASAYKNSYAAFVDGAAMVLFLIGMVQKVFFPQDGNGLYPGDKFWDTPGNQNGIGFNGSFQSAAQSIVSRTYQGFSHRRLSGGILGFYNDPDFLNDSFADASIQKYGIKKSDVIKVVETVQAGTNLNTTDATILGYLVSKFAVDTMIDAGNEYGLSTNPYQRLIKGTFSWETTRTSADTILKAIASVTNANMFFDAMGNLIYQKARYDDFPNYAAGDYDDPLAANSRGLAFIDGGDGIDASKPLIQSLGDGAYDIEIPGVSRQGLVCHGRNYIIGDESLKSWKTINNDTGIITAAVLAPIGNYLPLNAQLAAKQAGVFIDFAKQAQFGTRLASFPQVMTDNPNQQVLEVMAAMKVRQSNAHYDSIVMNFDNRSDLQVGRTAYLLPRRKMYYIERIQTTVVWGQQDGFTTSVTGRYGHNPLAPIGDPWSLLFNNKNVWATLESAQDLSIDQILQEINGRVPSLNALQSWQKPPAVS